MTSLPRDSYDPRTFVMLLDGKSAAEPGPVVPDELALGNVNPNSLFTDKLGTGDEQWG